MSLVVVMVTYDVSLLGDNGVLAISLINCCRVSLLAVYSVPVVTSIDCSACMLPVTVVMTTSDVIVSLLGDGKVALSAGVTGVKLNVTDVDGFSSVAT